ncbi:MAG TPA: hypothetical protein VLD39_17020 [Gammaproteobacteria bacterium]|nr:hypothetical protein [Gammaproteobacteria bacterium]
MGSVTDPGRAMRCFGSPCFFVPLVLGACAAEVAYEPEYLPPAIPQYLAETRVLILMAEEDAQYVYEGTADSRIGQTVTLRMPIGAIMREITASVFRTHFNYGVVFSDEPPRDLRYLVAIDPEIRNFAYRYEQRVEGGVVEMRETLGGLEAVPVTVITPTIEFELAVRAYDAMGQTILDQLYASGPVAGESYYVTSRPHERINATFHAALQQMMLEVAGDLRPFLAAQPNLLYTE